MKALKNIDRLQVNPDFLLSLLSVYESKGKEFYYAQVLERDRDIIRDKVVEVNTYFLSKYFDLDLTEARLKNLSRRKLQAKNKTETLVLNMKTAMNQVHNKNRFDLIVNEMVDLSRLLSKNIKKITINQYLDNNTLLANENSRKSKRNLLEQLVDLYQQTRKNRRIEITQIISNFYIDFLQLDIFSDYNMEVANIILYALLYNEFSVFKYVSFFKYFYEIKDEWELAISQAKHNWQSGYAQTDQLSKLIVSVILKSYEDIDEFIHQYIFDSKLNKTDNIENSILKGEEIFTKQDIRILHPTISEATIDRTLKRLKDDNIIRPIGRGRSSKWVRLVKGNNKINYEGTLFSFANDE